MFRFVPVILFATALPLAAETQTVEDEYDTLNPQDTGFGRIMSNIDNGVTDMPTCANCHSFSADGAVMGHRPDSKQGWGRLDVEAVVDPDQFTAVTAGTAQHVPVYAVINEFTVARGLDDIVFPQDAQVLRGDGLVQIQLAVNIEHFHWLIVHDVVHQGYTKRMR